MNLLNLADGVGADTRLFRHGLARHFRLRGGDGSRIGWRLVVRGQNAFLSQGQHPSLKIRQTAPAQMLLNHPQVHIVHGLEQLALHCIEGYAVFAADGVAVVPVHKHITPQHQRIPAPLRQDAALQRRFFILGQGVDVGKEFFVDRDVHNKAERFLMEKAWGNQE